LEDMAVPYHRYDLMTWLPQPFKAL